MKKWTKYDIMMRLAIFAGMLICSAIIAFTEIGVATAFDVRFNGLTYMDYLHEFYQVPWHFMLALGICVVAFVVAGESIYRSIMKIEEK